MRISRIDKKTAAARLFAAAAAAAAILLASCATVGPRAAKATPDEKAIAAGTAVWNEKGPAAARPHWNEIKDKTARETYAGYVEAFDSGSRLLEDAAASQARDPARSLASFEQARAALAALPGELTLPGQTRAGGITIAEQAMRSLIAADKLSTARDLGQAAVGTFGASAAVASMHAEIGVITASRKREAEADALRGRIPEADVDGRIAGIDKASAAYARAGTLLAGEAAKAQVTGSPNIAREQARLRRRRQDLAVEKERLLREQAYLFRDRIGEEFARVPDKEKVGTMGLEELLEHQQSVKEAVEAAYEEMARFAARYPQVADAEVMAEIQEQKRDLDAKIAQVNAEIRTAREIASRGKVVMPVMIGLFNPQPGTATEARKSRPAVFQARSVKDNEYWWGMVSIPRGTMNDLVVTVNDNRVVRVFADNTKGGTLIERNKMKDLVNRGYKVGNSWPVLNAGQQLASDKYFFEIQKGKTSSYEGEVVVYSSFIVRMR